MNAFKDSKQQTSNIYGAIAVCTGVWLSISPSFPTDSLLEGRPVSSYVLLMLRAPTCFLLDGSVTVMGDFSILIKMSKYTYARLSVYHQSWTTGAESGQETWFSWGSDPA